MGTHQTPSDEETLEYILKAIKECGYEPGKISVLAMMAASEWKGKAKGQYIAKERQGVHIS